MWKTVTIRGKDVSFSPKKICKYYDPNYYESDFLQNVGLMGFKDIHMESIVKYLTKNRGEWKLRLDTELLTNSHQANVSNN